MTFWRSPASAAEKDGVCSSDILKDCSVTRRAAATPPRRAAPRRSTRMVSVQWIGSCQIIQGVPRRAPPALPRPPGRCRRIDAASTRKSSWRVWPHCLGGAWWSP
eukprot:g8179.t1